MNLILKINNFLKILLIVIFIPFKIALSNQLIFEDNESFRGVNKEFLSEFNIGNKKSDTWREVFSDKTFEQINSFIENLPVRNTDEVIQDLIHEILLQKIV